MLAESLMDQLGRIRNYYNKGHTRQYTFRKKQLQILRSAIIQHEEDLHNALYADLKKSPEESWITETGFLISEINYTLRDLKGWMRPEKVKTNLVNFPSSSYVIREPLGIVLIVGPWNYPLQLLFNPLVGAMAGGNCAVLKASEFAPATSAIMKKIIEENFPNEYILFVEGEGSQVVPAMMNHFRFDHVFYTGGTVVGKIVYKMAADQLVPVTLELGGKSPCVVENDANIKVAARRIAMTKFANAGQMCVAPDYVLVQKNRKEELINSLKQTIINFYSSDPATNYNYCKIINEKQFNRLIGYLSNGTVVHGGRYDPAKLYIEPTVMENILPDSPIMQEEIFGPILPVIAFENFEEAKAIIDQHANPLAFYVYSSSSRKQMQWIESVPSGGSCINNSSWHFANHYLPLGGRGNSGIGEYHGKNSFETFSHRKAVMKTPTWLDPNIKYPPFKGKLWLFKKVVR